MRRISIVVAFPAMVMLSGCTVVQMDPSWSRNVSAPEAIGALAGGALGGYLGAQFGAGAGAATMTGLGVVAGAALGRELGRYLEAGDHPQAQQQYSWPPRAYGAQQYALSYGLSGVPQSAPFYIVYGAPSADVSAPGLAAAAPVR